MEKRVQGYKKASHRGQMKTIEDVRNFWENNPLFDGESSFEAGSKEFFQEHKRVCIEDCFAGNFKRDLFIPRGLTENAKVLDAGCGNGFWTVEVLAAEGFQHIYAADLAQRALTLTEKRLALHGFKANLAIENVESMTYKDEFFDHVNCQGVVHHTPNPEAAIREIARILKRNGTASISVYYKNIFLRLWPRISGLGRFLNKAGWQLRGRGRESIFLEADSDEIVRLYDGEENPIGKCYAKDEIIKMVEPYFDIGNYFFYFFPARCLPIKLPRFIHRFLSNNFGFTIHLNLRKKRDCHIKANF